jgi:putative methyltransferase (TIGR04325 family)
VANAQRTWASVVQGAARRLVRYGGEAPGVLRLRRLAHAAEFAQGRPRNGFSGAYATVADAARAAPRSRPHGYDHAEMAALYRANVGKMDPADYPVLFWLGKALPEVRRVFDFGGHVGLAYYAFERLLPFPPELEWLVCDVPAVARQGEALAAARGAARLRFTTRRSDVDGADVLLTSGALQYVEEGALHAMLRAAARRPRHVIVQRTPLHESRSFVTVQATGPAFCPYTVAARPAFVAGLEELGYALVDAWSQERRLDVPFHPECSVDGYSGLYFRAG